MKFWRKTKCILEQWKNAKAYLQLPEDKKEITFYAEDSASRNYFGQVIDQLTNSHGQDVSYLTSEINDPILQSNNEKIHSFYIGKEAVRTDLFLKLNCKLLIMTMPDLDTFFIKRSKTYPVKYIYFFHSIVSTHMIYRPHAFDNFDIIFTVGPHHEKEIRFAESLHQLPAKELISLGYPRLDELLRDQHQEKSQNKMSNKNTNVLLAPSWGPNGLLENHAERVCETILTGGMHLTVRPHPRTKQLCPQLCDQLNNRFSQNSNFILEESVVGSRTLKDSDVLITDWSGIAFEYFFTYKKPIIFVDVPRKINNPTYEKWPTEPIEVSLREKMGIILAIDQLDRISKVIEEMVDSPQISLEADKLAKETVFNIGRSEKTGAIEILRLLK